MYPIQTQSPSLLDIVRHVLLLRHSMSRVTGSRVHWFTGSLVRWFAGSLCQDEEQLVVAHRVECVDVDAQC